MLIREYFPRILFLLVCFFITQTGFSQTPPPAKYTIDDIYKAYTRYTPQEMMDWVQKGIDYFLEVGEEKAFAEFDAPYPTRWNQFPLGPQMLVMRCDEYRAVAHTLANQFPIFKQKGFAAQFKDVTGKKTYFLLCEGIKRNPEGFWVTQKQFWPETDGALLMGAYLKQIPGTPYQGHIFYPTQEYTAAELNTFVQE